MTEEEKIRLHNQHVKTWSSKVSRKLKSNVGSMLQSKVARPSNSNGRIKSPVKRIGELQPFVIRKADDSRLRLKQTIRVKNFKHNNVEIDGISITFAKHGVFVLKGSGPGNRTPKDWLNPILDQEMPELADKLGEMEADLILSETAKSLKNGNKD